MATQLLGNGWHGVWSRPRSAPTHGQHGCLLTRFHPARVRPTCRVGLCSRLSASSAPLLNALGAVVEAAAVGPGRWRLVGGEAVEDVLGELWDVVVVVVVRQRAAERDGAGRPDGPAVWGREVD